jgi:hypothetical protein
MGAITTTILSMSLVIIWASSPAAAISAELANKCREMAIKAHPPPSPPGNKAYAQAEREFFRTCVSQNGQMPANDAPGQK